MEIIGHRGAKGLEEDNTIDSFKRAIELNVDMIETDVRKQGGELVLSHDPTLVSESYTKLSELLELVNGKIPLNLEIKEERVLPLLKKALKNYKGRILFSSFNFNILQGIKKNFPTCEIAILESWSGIRAVARASLLGTNRLHIKQTWLWSNFVRSLDNKGYQLYAYTVNTKQRANELEEWGVKGIFTDYPNRFLK
jgi:glycerophosphoryl diester phosphodiesterase